MRKLDYMWKDCRIFFRIIKCKLKYSLVLAECISAIMMLFGMILIRVDAVRATYFLMRAHRNTREIRRQVLIERLFKKYKMLNRETMLLLIPKKFVNPEIYPARIFKLKEANKLEKGVLLIKYNGVMSRLGAFYNVDQIQRDYFLVLEPSFSGYCTPEILQFVNVEGSPVLVQSAEPLDLAFLKRINTNLYPIGIGSSNWVDDRVFIDLNMKKEFDCIMVALWGDIKRHYLLFKSLKEINDKSYRVCLIGGPLDRNQRDIENLAVYYGVRDTIEFHERLSPHVVNQYLNKSKVNVLLTLKEGANKSIFEGFFANVPGLVLKENFGVNKSYLNDQTGRLVPEKKLTEALLWFRENYVQFSPRKWALENISPVISTIRLEAKLKEIAVKQGELWTRSLVVKVNRPECEYYHPEEALSPLDLSLYSKQ